MVSPTIDRRFGLVGNAALKAPVLVVATTNITLSGEQTIDGVAVSHLNASNVPDRVLCTGQTDATQNGIYDVSTAAWSRSADADGPYDFANGTQVLVGGGTLYRLTVWCLVALSPITVGSSSLTWQLAIGASLGNFLQSGTGAQARTFTSKDRDIVSVKDFGAIGDGANHLLSTRYATLAAAQADYPFVTSLNQSIDYAAFQAAHNALSAANSSVGGTIRVPSGSYFLSNTWKIDKRVNIVGSHQADQPALAASALTFPADTDGIRVYSSIDSPNGTGGADYTHIEGLNLAASAKNASGNGIWATCVVNIERCVVRSFKGHGIYIHGVTGGGATGIADAWAVKHTRTASNGGDGLRAEGNDTNVGTVMQVESSANTGYGYYDNASYCNTYISCQAAGNGSAPYYNRNGTGFGGVYIGCYTESGAACDFDANVLVFGGVMNAGTGNHIKPDPSGGGMVLNVPAGARFLFERNLVEVARIETDNTLQGLVGAKFSTGASDYIDMTPGNEILIKGNTTAAQNRMVFQNPNGSVGSIQTSGSATSFNTSSDYRLKANVLPMQGALAKIALLKPCTYTWKVDGKPGQGFIAHELQEMFPDAVTGSKDAVDVVAMRGEDGEVLLDAEGLAVTTEVPRFQGVDTSFLVASLTAALQELNAKFDAYVAAHP